MGNLPERAPAADGVGRAAAAGRGRARVLFAVVLFAVVLALAALLSWARVQFNEVFPPGTILRVACEERLPASRPFDFRIFMPALVVRVRAFLGGAPSIESVFHVFDSAAIVGAFYALRRLARHALRDERAALLTALALFPALACHFVLPRLYPYWYAWDMSTVFFISTGLLLLRESRWFVFYPLFVLASYNRETTFVLSVVYALTALGREPWRRIALHVSAQAALWFAVKYSLYLSNPRAVGAKMLLYRPNAEKNEEALGELSTYLWLATSFAFAWIPLLLWWRAQRDPWTRRALWIVPLYALLMFRAANWGELRVWGELIPIVLLGAGAALTGRWLRPTPHV